jgi:pantoate--beta-alanine ligase
MEVIHSPDVARDFVLSLRRDGKTVGLVPTMGALHEGHLSLVRISRALCDATIATIFVNPTQFGPGEDLDKYPRTLVQDCDLLRAEGATAVFVPSNESMYPEGASTRIDPPSIAKPLEGAFRPEHFRGVATIVLKLFHCLPCNLAVFGRKDYQQWKVIEAMTRDLNIGIEILAGDIIREPDGLAMSSRNRYLDLAERSRALRLSESLRLVADAVESGQHDVSKLQKMMRQCLLGSSAPGTSGPVGVDKIDYAVVVDAETLTPLVEVDRPVVALIAARIGATRLIDNQVLIPPGNGLKGTNE